MDHIPDDLRNPLVALLLSVADDKFILGHRNADWTGLAPMLEEDIAFSSLAQDEIAHASALYQMIAALLGTTADKLAYGRKPAEYRCAEMVVLSDDFDWATALCRNFFCDHFDIIRLNQLAQSTYTPLAHLAARLAAEEKIHVEHVDSWLIRLGNGGAESRSRMQNALNKLKPLVDGLFEPTEGVERLLDAGVVPVTKPSTFQNWTDEINKVAIRAELRLEIPPAASNIRGGRRGHHSPAFATLLEELTEVYRLEPEAAW